MDSPRDNSPTSGTPETDAPSADPLQEQYDDAMFDVTTERYDEAIAKLEAILRLNPAHFDAQLALGMAWCRKGDFARAITEGHRAEKMRPQEQLVHTNLSLFYMRAGDKQTAEHHGLQARVASWRGNMAKPAAPAATPDSELKMAEAPPAPVKLPTQFPEQPWRKKTEAPGAAAPAGPAVHSSPPPAPPASQSSRIPSHE